jgi:DEAD/DEAH box helicase domain-containing protein
VAACNRASGIAVCTRPSHNVAVITQLSLNSRDTPLCKRNFGTISLGTVTAWAYSGHSVATLPTSSLRDTASDERVTAPDTQRQVEVAVGDLLNELAADGRWRHTHHRPARPGVINDCPQHLDPALLDRFGTAGLWRHQVEALNAVENGSHVAIATGTGSGKSLCYQLPIAQSIQDSPDPTALLLYPTKALAHDQLRSLGSRDIPLLKPCTFDGDSDRDHRQWARSESNVVMTNPEMLHYSLLPNHQRWHRFLRSLQFVVIDELHTYRGVFGSHLAHVLRRLRRLCAFHGSSPTFIFTSATIGQPAELASGLSGLPVVAVTEDAAPTSARTVALWDPEGSPAQDVGELVRRFVDRDQRTIAFCASRAGTEQVALHARAGTDRPIRAYRAGYLTNERRLIEQQLADGELMGVIATSALELGVDIGGLDVAILNGFPGTIASFWQQIGRVGRGQGASTSILVAGNDQLDQWFMAHPDELFTRPPEPAVINPSNPFVLRPHLACAAHELPLRPQDEEFWPDDLDDAVRDLVRADLVTIRNRRAVWNAPSSPASEISLRSGGAREVAIVDAGGARIGSVSGDRATSQVHPGAIYTHQGVPWRVSRLELDQHRAVVEPADGTERTAPRTTTDLAVLETYAATKSNGFDQHLGFVEVTRDVVGYRRIDSRTGQSLSQEPLDLPGDTLRTTAMWWTLPAARVAASGIDPKELPGALHAIEHAAIGLLPLFAICDRWDVGGVSTAHHADTGSASIFIYDGYEGGAGVADLGYERGGELLAATTELIAECACREGCPSCVQSPKCGNGNDPLSKPGALLLLRHALDVQHAA